MIYIIDANNLAGKLQILFEKDFDKKLITIIKQYFCEKKIKVFLVFDSNDLMGDKFSEDFVTVVYTPRDSYYSSADDKVVELLYDGIMNSKDEATLVTDDLEIIGKAEEVIKDTKTNKLFIEKATDFAQKIESRLEGKKIILDDGKRGLSDEEVNKIDNDLLNLWTKKES